MAKNLGEARPDRISPVVVERLPLYARALALLQYEGQEVVSSAELGERLRVTPAQIRKDLSYFGRFGKQGRGYNVSKLLEELRLILGLDRQWRMALIGVGKLGRAILEYGGFAPQGFRIVQAFDVNPDIVGKELGALVVRDVSELEPALAAEPVDIGIVAVPAQVAQQIIDALVRCGVKAILNYAPIPVHKPPGVEVRPVDPVLQLQRMAYYLKSLAIPTK
ncbi:MAG: redox-sensing transcriptional repressor Rex [Chloroflexota bacterium]|nr:redox-sensing transcriptional repressor Rex [Chloroflexota bacterium]